MNIDHLLTTSCMITTYTQGATVDQYGDPSPTTSTTTTTCWLHQDRRDDTTGLDDTQSERWTAYFPTGTSLAGHDTVTANSVTYAVKGPPWSAVNPRTGSGEFVVATLVRVT